MPEVTDKMLEAAMREAVKTGLLKKYADGETYMKNWEAMRRVLSVALDAAPESSGYRAPAPRHGRPKRREIDAKLFGLTNHDVTVRVCHGSDPVYIAGTLRQDDGTYSLDNGGRVIARFTLEEVRYVELGREVVELNEGAGDYWPPVL